MFCYPFHSYGSEAGKEFFDFGKHTKKMFVSQALVTWGIIGHVIVSRGFIFC